MKKYNVSIAEMLIYFARVQKVTGKPADGKFTNVTGPDGNKYQLWERFQGGKDMFSVHFKWQNPNGRSAQAKLVAAGEAKPSDFIWAYTEMTKKDAKTGKTVCCNDKPVKERKYWGVIDTRTCVPEMFDNGHKMRLKLDKDPEKCAVAIAQMESWLMAH